jgi:NADP-dependent 3-hydroxy acid dehydrogenase YdfG
MIKYAVVTGASSGIGKATAEVLAENGYTVIAAARRIDRLQELATEQSGIEIAELDVTDQRSVDAFANSLKDKHIAILVNNAGGAFDAQSVLDSDPEVWSKTYEVNVVGSVRMTKAIAPMMITQGHGHIVVMSSTAAHAAYENGGSYVAAKFAERSLANTLRLELSGTPIRVTELAPGIVKTEEFALNRNAGDLAKASKVYEGIEFPLLAEDVAEAVRWCVTLPEHVNIDSLIVRPIAQAANHKVHRVAK